mmetsp:Transcript_28434/g.55329  ORF Transcript_28434/g.55329 Transcript_28434/m.55329 type:complete len:95 (+) Transcript_28434:309-593(+)
MMEEFDQPSTKIALSMAWYGSSHASMYVDDEFVHSLVDIESCLPIHNPRTSTAWRTLSSDCRANRRTREPVMLIEEEMMRDEPTDSCGWSYFCY